MDIGNRLLCVSERLEVLGLTEDVQRELEELKLGCEGTGECSRVLERVLREWNRIPRHRHLRDTDHGQAWMEKRRLLLVRLLRRLAHLSGATTVATGGWEHELKESIENALAHVAENSATVEERAIAAKLSHREWSNRQVAEHIGCHVKTLSKKSFATYRAVAAACRDDQSAVAPSPPHGYKDRDGNIDAW